MSGQLQIQLTATAEATYARYYEEAEGCKGDGSNPKVKLFRTLDEALTKVIPSDPFNSQIALSGCLSDIFRFRRETLRICYIGHGPQRRIVVLYICESCAEESDSYVTFAHMVMSGKFDAAFTSLGLRPPDREGIFQNPQIN